MASNIYFKLSKIFLGLSIVLLALSITSAICIIIIEFPIKPSFDHQGFENFTIYFSFPLKALTATFATFAIWLTLERMNQTERQINAIADNNKFNNYNKQLQDFLEYMTDTSLFAAIYGIDKTPLRGIIVPLYKIYYAETYETFRPRVKESVKNEIDKFYLEVANSPLAAQNCDFSKLPITEIKKLSSKTSEHVRELIIPLTARIFSRIQSAYTSKSLPAQTIELTKERMQEFYAISWTLAFYRSLRIFDGQMDTTSGHFQDNFEHYYSNLGV